MKNNLGSQLIGNRTALILSLFALSAFSFHLENDILAESHPFILFDPFEKSSSSPLHDSLDEICNDGQDNNGDGLVDENCSNSQISKENGDNHPPAMPQKDSDKSGIREIYPTKPNG